MSSPSAASPTKEPASRVQLLLWGFMGTGKSTVGALVAQGAGVPFLDLDEQLQAEHGPIEDIFARYGETVFRLYESAALSELLDAPAPRVIALGGGTLIDPALRARALSEAFVIVLEADVDTIVARTAGSRRPLLANDPQTAVGRLLASRAAAYDEAHEQLDSHGEPAAIARHILRIWSARGG